MSRCALIDGYLAQVADRLDGAEPKWRRQVLEEMRRGLERSAARYECCGVSRPDAERSAVEEWGSADVLARDFGYESLRFGQRRLSCLVLVTLPVLSAMWAVLLLTGPEAPWPAVPIEVEIAGRLLSLVAVAASVASVYTLVSQRRWARIRYRASMFAGGGLAVAVAVALMLFVERTVIDPHSIAWPWAAGPIAASVYVAATLVADMRCLVHSSRIASRPAQPAEQAEPAGPLA